jgi:hypothetical protein
MADSGGASGSKPPERPKANMRQMTLASFGYKKVAMEASNVKAAPKFTHGIMDAIRVRQEDRAARAQASVVAAKAVSVRVVGRPNGSTFIFPFLRIGLPRALPRTVVAQPLKVLAPGERGSYMDWSQDAVDRAVKLHREHHQHRPRGGITDAVEHLQLLFPDEYSRLSHATMTSWIECGGVRGSKANFHKLCPDVM